MPRLLAPALIGVLLVTSLSAVLTDAAGFSNVQTSTITVKEKEVYCTDDRVHESLVVKDQADNIIKQTTVGTQVSLEGILNLDCNTGDSPVMLFEVRDAEGITTYLAWQIFSIESSGQITTGSSWMPDKPGNYDVRLFTIVCFRCLGIFHNIVTYEITVV